MGNYNYKISYREQGQTEWTALKCATLPFKLQLTLDETLDTGKLKLVNTRRKQVFKPFTAIKYEMTCTYPQKDVYTGVSNDIKLTGDTIYMIVMRDMVAQTTCYEVDGSINGPIYYDHTVEVIEPTKCLERHICDTLTFTNSIEKTYDKAGGEAVLRKEGNLRYLTSVNVSYNRYYKEKEKITIQSYADAITDSIGEPSNIQPVVRRTLMISNQNGIIAVIGDKNIAYELSLETGYYTVEYYGGFSGLTSEGAEFKVLFDITIVKSKPASPPWSIARVINRILSSGVTRREGIDKQAFTLDPKLVDKYSKIPAPEFHITRSSLFEALLQVGAFIHAVPRLIWNAATDNADIVTFDELGGNSEYNIPDYCSPLFNVVAHDINEYSGYIDSIAENVINTANPLEGSVVSGWKTMRAEEGTVIISNDTACILTEFPMYRVLKVEMGQVNASSDAVGDITPFVYEASEYATLSAYESDFPYSLQYALKYTQGGNAITGFNYVPPKPVLKGMPVIKAIFEKLGVSQADSKFNKYAFRVTYIPIMSGRFKQFKPYVDGYPMELGLISNQSANTVESGYYGENLKGQIARVGEEVRKIGYRFKRVNTLPKIGQMFQGNYISGLEFEFHPQYITCYMELAPYFNRLSNYIGLNSNFRMYDISEKQSVDRHINYSTVVEVGDIAVDHVSNMNYNNYSIGNIAALFTNRHLVAIDHAVITLKQNSTDVGDKFILPCTSLALGNSIAFTLHFKDNYGIGYSCVNLPDDKDKDVETERKVSELVRAGNDFGEFKYMDVKFGYLDNYMDWARQVDMKKYPNTMPRLTSDTNDFISLIELDNLIINKDSRERIIFTYQMHFSSNNRNVVIGKAMTYHNPFVVNRDFVNNDEFSSDFMKYAYFVFLPYKINMLQNTLDVYGGYLLKQMDFTKDYDFVKNETGEIVLDKLQLKIKSQTNNSPNPFKSWVIYDPVTMYYYLGENVDIAPGDATNELTINF